MHILDVHGDPLEGCSSHIHIWINVSTMRAGITGTKLKMRVPLAFMSTGISG